jgi:menaquinone-dependent protoporphyrinogen oxidase
MGKILVKEYKVDRKILVTYASKYGATAEIAGKISDLLLQVGLQVDLFSVDNVRDLAPYHAVILGSGVYIGQWNKKAAVFLQNNEEALTERQVWLFSSGPTGVGDPVELLNGWRLPAALQPVANRIQPRDTVVFHGFINPGKLNFIQKLAIKNIVKKPFGDYRDWDAIAAWTGSVAKALSVH